MKTNLSAIVRAYAAQEEVSLKEAGRQVKSVLGVINDELIKGNDVSLTGFGSFNIKERKGKINGKAYKSKTIRFKAFKNLKAKVNK